jgi:hypothetical protein
MREVEGGPELVRRELAELSWAENVRCRARGSDESDARGFDD